MTVDIQGGLPGEGCWEDVPGTNTEAVQQPGQLSIHTGKIFGRLAVRRQ